jgi:IS30 family transposase
MVVDNLRAGLSPEQIAATLKRMAPALAPVQLSHEAIYQAIYAMPRGDLRSEVIALLRHGHSKRRPRARGKDRRGQIPNMVPISERPAEIEQRLIPGHWEGDTIKGKYNQSAVGTLVERTSLFALLAKMNGTGAEAAVEGFTRVLDRVEAQKRLSVTYDRGKEMAQHEKLSANTGIKVYFADPHAPWQRGINENTNGLIRQFLPKGQDLSIHSQEELDKIAWLLNSRPRKSLGWKCPAEIFLPDFDFVKYYSKFFALRT